MALTDTGRALVNRQELSPIWFLERAGTVHERRVAVVDGTVTYTFGEWRDRAWRMANALRAAGLEKGDRVAFLALNSEPLLLAHFAVPMAGGVLVAINTRLTAGEVGYILDHSGSKLVFHSPELRAGLEQAPGAVRRLDLATELEPMLAGANPEPVDPGLDNECETIAIDYTSGTTGRPKGVVYHHRGAYLNAIAVAMDMGLGPGSRYLWTLPMFHCNGWCFPWGTVATGATGVCIPRVDPERIWELLKAGEATSFCAAPTVLIMLVNHPAATRLERPVRVFTGGAPPSPTLIGQLSGLNIELEHVYGLTETYGPFTVNVRPPDFGRLDAPEQARLRARQGVANLLAGQVRVVDAGMSDVAADGEAMGEVVMRGNTIMTGYFRDEPATESVFAGGWFHSGDVGVMHPDGHIELRDRKKDVIISGGENISTIEVEQAVASHPGVLEVAVIAVPDDKWGEVPKAFVTAKPGQRPTEAEVIAHCRARLAGFKVPKAVEFCDLPKTSTGKIQKFVLRDREWAGRDRRIN